MRHWTADVEITPTGTFYIQMYEWEYDGQEEHLSDVDEPTITEGLEFQTREDAFVVLAGLNLNYRRM